jgi:hypothetical protein
MQIASLGAAGLRCSGVLRRPRAVRNLHVALQHRQRCRYQGATGRMSGIVHSNHARRVLNCVFAVGLSSCSTALDSELDNLACSSDGRCLAGYVCSEDDLCVRALNSRADVVRSLKPKRSASDAAAPASESEVFDGGGRDASVNDASVPATDAPSAPPPVPPKAASAAGSGGAAGTTSAPNVDTGGDVTIAVPTPIAGAAGSTAPPPAVAGAPSTPPPPPPTAGTGGAAGRGGPPVPAAGAPAPAPACAKGLTLCGSRCVDLTADANNCGACGNACDGAAECSKAKCHVPKDD